MKGWQIALSVVLLVILVWVVLASHMSGSMRIQVNGREVSNPLVRFIVGSVGLAVVAAVMFVGGVILLFFLSGFGMAVAAVAILAGLILCAIAAPLFLPLLLPLGAMFLFMKRKRDPSAKPPPGEKLQIPHRRNGKV